MQDSPPRETLLLAVAKFLAEDLRPHVTDPKLSFNLLIAAHLCMGVATECAQGEAQDRAELERLRGIFPDESGNLRTANAWLAKALREGALSAEKRSAVQKHLQETLREKLTMNNPRFDLRGEIENP